MKSDNNTPSIRFAGFTDVWGYCKLKDITTLITKGTTPLDKSNTGDVNFVKIENINNDTGEITITQRISRSEHDTYLRRSQLKENDILFSIAGTLGRVTSVNANILPANTNQALAILRLKNGNNKYIKTYLKGKAISDFVRKNPTVGAQPNLSLEQVGNLEINLPCEVEQEQISSFFALLDCSISLHQRKYEKLVNLKKAMLDKMFPKNGELVPEVRFAGFSGNWERRKLGEIACKVTEKNYAEAISETFTNSAENGIISQREYFDHDISNPSNLAGYFVVQENDFIYNPRISSTAPVGPVNRNKLNRKGLVSPIYTVFRTCKIDNLYLEYFFKTRHWHPYMFYNGDSGARSDRFSIKDSLFMSMPIVLPSQSEQKSIGRFLECVDSNIMLQHQKLERLQNLKKAFLDKMFV